MSHIPLRKPAQNKVANGVTHQRPQSISTGTLQAKIACGTKQSQQVRQVEQWHSISQKKGNGDVLQAKFVSSTGKVVPLEQLSLGFKRKGNIIPVELNNIFTILCKADESIDTSKLKSFDDFVTYLRSREPDYRPEVGFHHEATGKWRKAPIPGALSTEHPGTLEHWEVEKSDSPTYPAAYNPATELHLLM